MKNKVLLFILVILIPAGILITVLLIPHKQKVTTVDISIIENYPNKAYNQLGYYKGAKFPIFLNFEKQDERFSAKEEFLNYVLIASNKYEENVYYPDSVIAYKVDLNNDGIDEIIGIVKSDFLTDKKNGQKIIILIPSEVYKMQNSGVERFDKDYLGFQRIAYHTGYYNQTLSGIYVMPQMTNGFHDLNLFNLQAEMFRRVTERYSPYFNRVGLDSDYARSIYLRFNNERSPYYKYELSID